MFFHLSVKNQYSIFAEKAIKLNYTTYMYEKGFSTFTYLKERHRNRLNTETDLRFKLLDNEPNFFVLPNRHKFPIEDCFQLLTYLYSYDIIPLFSKAYLV